MNCKFCSRERSHISRIEVDMSLERDPGRKRRLKRDKKAAERRLAAHVQAEHQLELFPLGVDR